MLMVQQCAGQRGQRPAQAEIALGNKGLNAGRLTLRRAFFQGKSPTHILQSPESIAMCLISDNFSMLPRALLVV